MHFSSVLEMRAISKAILMGWGAVQSHPPEPRPKIPDIRDPSAFSADHVKSTISCVSANQAKPTIRAGLPRCNKSPSSIRQSLAWPGSFWPPPSRSTHALYCIIKLITLANPICIRCVAPSERQQLHYPSDLPYPTPLPCPFLQRIVHLHACIDKPHDNLIPQTSPHSTLGITSPNDSVSNTTLH